MTPDFTSLKPIDVRILRLLSESSRPLSYCEITDQTGIEMSYLYNRVCILEKKGIIQRRRCFNTMAVSLSPEDTKVKIWLSIV